MSKYCEHDMYAVEYLRIHDVKNPVSIMILQETKRKIDDAIAALPDDLYVSVKNNRIVLRSKRLNKEIIPRMSMAHNYSGNYSMPVYHFLCDMQHQAGRTGLGLFRNDAAQQLDYLPWVVYKNCILSQARRRVRGEETKAFTGIRDDRELLSKVKEWQSGRNIPDNVLLSAGDNELYVDMNHPLSIRAWLSVVKKRPSFHLEEFLFDPATAVVRGSEGVLPMSSFLLFTGNRQYTSEIAKKK
jgi:hypothetical protein